MSASRPRLSLRSSALWLLIVLPFVPQRADAQHLYMPRSFRHAIASGTRTLTGQPGAKYWENHASYQITLNVLPPDRTVRGKEEILYRNNSPDTLRALDIRLFLNYRRPTAPRQGATTEANFNAGEIIDRFAVNGQPQTWRENPRSTTYQLVTLPQPLLPHDSVRLAFDWHYEIAQRASREGMLDSTSYYIAYFYPRVAVYDDVDGWDMMEHVGHEFYSDFNDYDVTVRTPRNYVVWATGMLANAKTVLQPAALSRYQNSLTNDGTVHVATASQTAAGEITKQDSINEWRFTSSDVPDVALAVSNHYEWDGGSVVVDTTNGRRASVQSAYLASAPDYPYMVKFGEHALGWLSRNWPGVPYPYPKSTIVQGSADMEYPMMVNDGSNADTTFSKFVAEHEIAHTYMPFYMGIDETRFAFMDEGWATTFEYLIGVNDVGAQREEGFFKMFRVNRWAHALSQAEDVPIVTPADVLGGAAYGNNAYGKASLGYLAMKDMLGDALFKKCLQAYMARWHGKHPQPWDYFYTYDDVTGRNLDWFWRAWFFNSGYIDLAVTEVRKTKGGYDVGIDNIGGMPAPTDVQLTFADGSKSTVHETAAMWQANLQHAVVHVTTTKTLKSLVLEGGIWMDADPSNNGWKS